MPKSAARSCAGVRACVLSMASRSLQEWIACGLRCVVRCTHGLGLALTGVSAWASTIHTRHVTSACRGECSTQTHGRPVRYTKNAIIWSRPVLKWCSIACETSACVVKNDLPALRALAPNERKDAIVLGCFAVGGPREVELSGHEGNLGSAALGGKQPDVNLRKGQRSHLLARSVALLVALKNRLVSLSELLPDESGVGRVFIGLHESREVGAVPGLGLRLNSLADRGFIRG